MACLLGEYLSSVLSANSVGKSVQERYASWQVLDILFYTSGLVRRHTYVAPQARL